VAARAVGLSVSGAAVVVVGMMCALWRNI
jgi:hypothetical protein